MDKYLLLHKTLYSQLMKLRPKAVAYVDGLNFYKLRLSRNKSLRWVNPLSLIKVLFPDYEIVQMHYFTSELRRTDSISAQKLGRQKTYLRALRTLSPNLEYHLGRFRADSRELPSMPLSLNSSGSDYRRVRVLKVEEKGSDVHLGARLVADAALRKFDFQIIVSNDSDLVPALEIAISEFGSEIDLVLPLEEILRGSNQLRQRKLHSIRTVPTDKLVVSQFDEVLQDSQGLFHRPSAWT